MKFRSWMVCAVVVLTLCMNMTTIDRLVRNGFRLATSWRFGYRGISETVDATRRMAALAKVSDKSIAYCRSCETGLLPIERSRVLAMSWETAPYPVRNGLLGEIIGTDAIVAAEYEPLIGLELRNRDYYIYDSAGGVNLWCRGKGWKDYPNYVEHRQGAEILSLTAIIAFFVCCYFVCGYEGVVIGMVGLSVVKFVFAGVLGSISLGLSLCVAIFVIGCLLLWRSRILSCRRRSNFAPPQFVTRGGLLVMLFLFIIYAMFSLTHTFVAPNGLGTVGGRAKLMFLYGGINDGFFTNPMFALFQPAYPPGAASLILWCDAISGCCGEWIIQLLPCVFMAAMAEFLSSRLRSVWGVLMVFIVFTTPMSIRLATLFYPEVYVAACCLIGWERVRENSLDYIGWLLIGASGWFKNEGLVYFCSVAMAVFVISPHIGFRRLALRVALGLVLPVSWYIGCRLAGASFDGYLPLSQLRIDQFESATYRALQYMFCSAWRYAFIFPLSFVIILTSRWRNRNIIAMVIGVLFALVGFAVVFSMSAATDFEWHLDSMERLLWVPSLLILRECYGIFERGTRRELFLMGEPQRGNKRVRATICCNLGCDFLK